MTSTLAVQDAQLKALYSGSLNAGTEDAGEAGSYPIIRLTTPSSKNELSNGKRATVGFFYSTDSKTEVKTLTANICYIGKFYLPHYVTKEKKLTYVLGVMRQDNTPAILFVKGMSLQGLWAYMKDVSQIRHSYKVPMYALQTVIGTEERSTEKFGDVTAVKLSVKRDSKGNVIVEQDPKRAMMLLDSVKKFKEVIAQMLNQEEESDEYAAQSVQPVFRLTTPELTKEYEKALLNGEPQQAHSHYNEDPRDNVNTASIAEDIPF